MYRHRDKYRHRDRDRNRDRFRDTGTGTCTGTGTGTETGIGSETQGQGQVQLQRQGETQNRARDRYRDRQRDRNRCIWSQTKHFQKVTLFPGFVLQHTVQHQVVKLATSHQKCCQNVETFPRGKSAHCLTPTSGTLTIMSKSH